MKPYASKCQLIDIAEDGTKTYKVWIQKQDAHNGKTVKYTITEYAKGKDMQGALRSVLKQPLVDKLKSVPNNVYVTLSILGLIPWAFTFSKSPFLALGLLGASAVVAVIALNKYFKYNV